MGTRWVVDTGDRNPIAMVAEALRLGGGVPATCEDDVDSVRGIFSVQLLAYDAYQSSRCHLCDHLARYFTY